MSKNPLCSNILRNIMLSIMYELYRNNILDTIGFTTNAIEVQNRMEKVLKHRDDSRHTMCSGPLLKTERQDIL